MQRPVRPLAGSPLSGTVPRRQAARENDACAPLLCRNPSDLGSQPRFASDLSGAGTPACAPLLNRNPSNLGSQPRFVSDFSGTGTPACALLLNRNPSDLGSQPHIARDDRKTNGPKFCRSRFQPRHNAECKNVGFSA